MKLSEVKQQLATMNELRFRLPNGSYVPKYFHITEVGMVSKQFIDCGGKVRNEKSVSFQLWQANDYDHRLAPGKLLDIIKFSENKLSIEDAEVEVEYQAETIGKYGVDFDGTDLLLTAKQTDCLAKDNCGILQEKPKIKLSALQAEGCCTSDSSCCQ